MFKKEYNKIQDSKWSGADTDDLYETTLWYYDLLMFTIEQEPLCKSFVVMAKREEGGQEEEHLVFSLDESSVSIKFIYAPTATAPHHPN